MKKTDKRHTGNENMNRSRQQQHRPGGGQRVRVLATGELGTVTDRVLMPGCRDGRARPYVQVRLDNRPGLDRWFWPDQLGGTRERCRATFEAAVFGADVPDFAGEAELDKSGDVQTQMGSTDNAISYLDFSHFDEESFNAWAGPYFIDAIDRIEPSEKSLELTYVNGDDGWELDAESNDALAQVFL